MWDVGDALFPHNTVSVFISGAYIVKHRTVKELTKIYEREYERNSNGIKTVGFQECISRK